MNNIIIKALAGTGKTTKLIEYMNKLEGDILYLSFNKSIEKELKKYESENIKVTTVHALALDSVSKSLNKKIIPRGFYTTYEIKKILNLSKYDQTFPLLNMIKDFCYSDLTGKDFILFVKNNDNYRNTFSIDYETIYLFKTFLKIVMDDNYMAHDIYLKLFQLSKPILKYDNILVDEFQDFSDVMLDIIKNQDKRTRIIVAGDEYQRIYEWRGVSSKFDQNLNNFKTKYLTNTWRSPQSVLEIVNPYIRFLSNDEEFELKSNNKENGKVILIKESFKLNDIKEDYTFVSYSNPILINTIQYYMEFPCNIKLNIGTTLKGIKEHYLWLHGEESKNNFLDNYFRGTPKALARFYTKKCNIEKLSQLKCAEKINDYEEFTKRLRKRNKKLPTLYFYNIFTVKGLEFDNVIIMDDFQSPFDFKYKYITDQDIKYLYVAMTRAKKNLYIPEKYISHNEVLQIPSEIYYFKSKNNEDYLSKKIRLIEINNKLGRVRSRKQISTITKNYYNNYSQKSLRAKMIQSWLENKSVKAIEFEDHLEMGGISSRKDQEDLYLYLHGLL